MENLFASSSIGTMAVKNHFIRSATSERKATEDGHLTDALRGIYRDLADGGVGTIITGFTFVCKDEQPVPHMMGIYEDSFVPEYREFVQMVHEHGASIVLQIVYGGSQKQADPGNPHVWGLSAVKHETSGITPIEMSREDIRLLIGYFAEAARRAKEAGFDGVQIHAAHGYFLSQSLSPKYNRRTDEYGGSAENRARLLMEVYQAVRKAVGREYPVWVKINSADDVEGGLTYADSLRVSQMLSAAGIDAIEVSGGDYFHNSRTKETESYFRDYAMELSGLVSTPVILTGGNRTLKVMQQIADSSRVRYFGFSRPLMQDPSFIRLLEKQAAESEENSVQAGV